MNFNMEKFLSYYSSVIMDWFGKYSIKTVAAVLVLVIGSWIARRVSGLLKTVLEKNDVDITLVGFLTNIIYYALLIMVVIAAAGQLGVNTTSFLAIVGAAGLAVGLALKDSLSNFASGVMLILFRPFKVNDIVTAGGVSGRVESVTIFSTVINTVNNQRVIVPNKSITSSVITNVTANPVRRVDFLVGVKGYENEGAVKETLEKILVADPRVLKDPESVVKVIELVDEGVSIVVRPWVKTPDYNDFYFEFIETVKKAFDEKNVTVTLTPKLSTFPEFS